MGKCLSVVFFHFIEETPSVSNIFVGFIFESADTAVMSAPITWSKRYPITYDRPCWLKGRL